MDIGLLKKVLKTVGHFSCDIKYDFNEEYKSIILETAVYRDNQRVFTDLKNIFVLNTKKSQKSFNFSI